jgi:hypothetical protein
MRIKTVKPEYVRAAIHSAVSRGLKFPSPEIEKFIADFLNGLIEVV